MAEIGAKYGAFQTADVSQSRTCFGCPTTDQIDGLRPNRGIGEMCSVCVVRAETQFHSLRWRASAAPSDVPNEGLLARVNLVGLHRSPRRNASIQLSLQRCGAQDLSSFAIERNLHRRQTPPRPMKKVTFCREREKSCRHAVSKQL